MRKLKFNLKKSESVGGIPGAASYDFEATSGPQRLIVFTFPKDTPAAGRESRLRAMAEMMGTDFVIVAVTEGETFEVFEEVE